MEQKSSLATNHEPLQISESSEIYLKETGSWASFLSIIGFILIGLIVIIAIGISIFLPAANNQSITPISGLVLGIIYILMGLLYFFPVLYLYKFSTNMKKAIEKKSSENLDDAFKNIKSHYKFAGIFTIIFIALYILGAVVMLIFGSFF